MFFFCNVTCNLGEARLEPMMLSEPNTDCEPDQERCIWHRPRRMMQIFSLKLAQIPIGNNLVELYGYIAARDCRDSLLNYIVNRSRDNPIVVQQVQLSDYFIHFAILVQRCHMQDANELI